MGVARAVPVLLLLALLFSCDEFMLRKTVAVDRLSGEMTFDPGTPSLSGVLSYSIRNNQSSSLSEVYFISHTHVSLDYVSFEGDTARFEQGVGYGYGIHRVRIPPLAKGKKARIDIRFHVDGPIEDDRFLLTRDGVFLDAEKIWLPVPFAQKPAFSYELRVRTPEQYYSVLGARLSEESTNGGKRTALWESELNDVVLTGNMFIGRFQRVRGNGPLFLYAHRTNNADALSRLVQGTLSVYRDRIGKYPFSQIHMIAGVFQYQDMEEFIDGQASANIIQVAPDLITNAYLPEAEAARSVLPDVPRNSFWKTAEAVNHELGHAYVRGILKFEEDSWVESESLTEFLGLSVIALSNRAVYGKFIERNRIELINLELAAKENTRLYRYLFGVNCLHTAFALNPDGFFPFLRTLIEKYEYTHIQAEQLLSTASEMNFLLTNAAETTNGVPAGLFDTEALRLWSESGNALGNIRLSLSNVWVTNHLGRRKYAVEQKFVLTIANEFPVEIGVTLTETYRNRSESNDFRIPAGDETSVVVDRNIVSASVRSAFEALEKNLSDNSLMIHGQDREWRDIESGIQAYYRNEPLPATLTVENPRSLRDGWRGLPADRRKTRALGADIRFTADRYRDNGRQFALSAYKRIGDKPFSYVVFQGRRSANGRVLTAVIDPALE